MSEASPPITPATNGGALNPGATLAGGRYVITRKLGEGGMGVVYLAEQQPVGRHVVVKLIHRHLLNDPEVVGRFEREMHVTARIEHPNTVRVYDCGQENGQPFLVTEYVPGEDLATLLNREGRLASDRLALIAEQIARGLRAAHAAGIVHRDLKPANVMIQTSLGERDRVTVLDFGIAKPLGEHGHLKTGAGLLIGTPTYMSPEQCAGTNVDARSDLYALGLLMFEMAVGRPPFTQEAATALLVAHISTPPPRVAEVAPALPQPLQQLIDGLLEKLPDQRPPSADAVVKSLETIRADLRPTTIKKDAPALPRTSVLQVPAALMAEVRNQKPADLRTPTVNASAASWPRASEGGVSTTGSKRGPFRWVLLGAAAVGAVVIWKIAGSPTSKQAANRTDQSAWTVLSPPDEPPYPDECRSGASGLPQLLSQIPTSVEAPKADETWLASVRKLPDTSPEKWLLLARHGVDDAERGEATRKAVQACQSSAVAHNLLGNLLQKEGAFAESASQYEQAIALSGVYLAPRFNLAVLDLRQGKLDPALARLEGLQRDRPDYPGLSLLLGRALLAATRAEDAVGVLRAELDKPRGAGTNHADLWYLLGEAYVRLENAGQAGQAFCKAKAEGSTEAAKRCPRDISAKDGSNRLPPK